MHALQTSRPSRAIIPLGQYGGADSGQEDDSSNDGNFHADSGSDNKIMTGT